MEKFVLEENIKLQNRLYKDNLNEFKIAKDKEKLINDKYKKHNMRFSVIIDRNIAIENNDLEFANFLDSIINDMTQEISLLNKSALEGNIKKTLKKLSFHDKVNIFFYVRPDYYDKEFEPYEILTEYTYKELLYSIIQEANNILKDYNKTLIEISKMSLRNVYDLIKDDDLSLDILFVTELIKKGNAFAIKTF